MAAGEAPVGPAGAAGTVVAAPEVGPGAEPGPALESLVYMSTLAVKVSALGSAFVGAGVMVIEVILEARGRVSILKTNSVRAK